MALLYTDLTVRINDVIIDDYFSFIWTDRFNTVGDFEMILPFTKKNSDLCTIGDNDVIVTCNLSSRAMIIENVIIQISPESGKQIKISGRSYESILDRRVVADSIFYTDDYYSDNKVSQAFNDILKKTFGANRNIQVLNKSNNFDPGNTVYKYGSNKTNYIYVALPSTGSKTVSRTQDYLGFEIRDNSKKDIWNCHINIDATGKSFLELIEEFCKAKGFGYKLVNGTVVLYATRENNDYIFSVSNDNLVSAEYMVSSENYKNVAFVEGDEYKKAAKVQTVQEGQMLLMESEEDSKAINYRVQVQKGDPKGLNRREIYIKSSKSKGDNTNRKYCARLSAEGMANLANQSKMKKQASCEVMKNVYIDFYGKSFDLGDIVTVELEGIYDPLDKTGNINGAKITDKMVVDQFTISHSESGLELYPVLVWYDPDQLKNSNDADAGFEEGKELIDSVYSKKVKCYFNYNGGKHPQEATSFRVNKKKDRKKDGTWYLLPDHLNEMTVIETDAITGVYNWQEAGNWMKTPQNPPVWEHHTFLGWFITNGERVESYDSSKPDSDQPYLYPVGGDVTGQGIYWASEHNLIARWEPEKFKIIFNPGEGGYFSVSSTLNEDGYIEQMCNYGEMPRPPQVIPKKGYAYDTPMWDPTIEPVTGEATYTARWKQIGDTEDDPEDARYKNDDLPSDGTTDRSKKSTGADSSDETEQQYNLIHFRSYKSRVDDEYGNPNSSTHRLSRTADERIQGAEMYFERDVGNGLIMSAHWFDCNGHTSHSGQTTGGAGQFSSMQNTRVGIALWKNDHILAVWNWDGPGGYAWTPEIAFTTIPEYEPYYEKQTLQWGYDHGEIKMGLLHLAPIFVPFKYYRKIRINNKDTYWLLCVPPLDWLSNWGSYYYNHQAGYDVGFCCQFYDDAGDVLSPTWVRADGENSLKATINGEEYVCPTDLSYNHYYSGSSSVTGPNTIYSPNSSIYRTSTSNRSVSFSTLWTEMGWKWKRIPNERFEADGSELYSPTNFDQLLNYSGNLLMNEQASFSSSWGGHGFWTEYYYYMTLGMLLGPRCYGHSLYKGHYYGTYSGDYEWSVEERLPNGYSGSSDEANNGILGESFVGSDEILYKLSGQSTMGARIIEQINNVISKSNSLSYFTYKVFLPLVAKVKRRKWYVSSDGQNWYLITGAEGNSLKVKTTNKTVAENEAAGLTGADAVVGTNNSYYKSEVYYEDEQGREFMQTSDVGQLKIDDTDISGEGIEMDDLMNPDGTTKGLDIADPVGFFYNENTENLKPGDVNQEMLDRIASLYGTGLSKKDIAETVGISEWFVDAMVSGFED